MDSTKGRNIVIGLVIISLIILFCGISDKDCSNHYSGEQPQTQYHSSYPFNESERAFPSSSTRLNNPTSPTRHEVLQTKVKGYRETTYWGSEHPVVEEIRHYSDDEFDRYINEKVELKDADAYWGTEY